jgi:hypothetical protein
MKVIQHCHLKGEKNVVDATPEAESAYVEFCISAVEASEGLFRRCECALKCAKWALGLLRLPASPPFPPSNAPLDKAQATTTPKAQPLIRTCHTAPQRKFILGNWKTHSSTWRAPLATHEIQTSCWSVGVCYLGESGPPAGDVRCTSRRGIEEEAQPARLAGATARLCCCCSCQAKRALPMPSHRPKPTPRKGVTRRVLLLWPGNIDSKHHEPTCRGARSQLE